MKFCISQGSVAT